MDTSDAARRRQLAIYAAMPGADKVTLAVEMAEQSKAIALGASRIDVGRGDASRMVLADPEGNECCVLSSRRPSQ